MPTSTVLATIRPGAQQLATASGITPQEPPPNAVSKPVQAAAPAAPSPGRFQHPAMSKIARRQSAQSFTSTNIRVALVNAGVLLATGFGSNMLYHAVEMAVRYARLEAISLDAFWIISFLRFILVANIWYALRPAIPYGDKPDPAEDIPLTPSQRALLGLHPSTSSSQKADGHYITPPRYRRSSPSSHAGTPQSGGSDRRSVSANYSASPMSTSRFTVGFSPTPQQGSATPGRRASGSQYSQSPLFKKSLPNSSSIGDIASNADFTESTRSLLAGNVSTSSFNGSLRRSQSLRDRLGRQQEPATPSPGAKERSKIKLQPGLNYKWLYEKGMKIGPNGNVEY